MKKTKFQASTFFSWAFWVLVLGSSLGLGSCGVVELPLVAVELGDRLQQDPNAKAVIIGESDPSEKGKNLAAQRAVNAKAYLTSGENQKAIDPSRIQVVTGTGGEMKDEPAGGAPGRHPNKPCQMA